MRGIGRGWSKLEDDKVEYNQISGSIQRWGESDVMQRMQLKKVKYSIEFSHSDTRMQNGKLFYARCQTIGFYSIMPTRLHFEDDDSNRRTRMADTRESKRITGSGSLQDEDDEQS